MNINTIQVRRFILFTALLTLPAFGFTQSTVLKNENVDPHYQLIGADNYVQSKNYYLLTLFNEIPAVRNLLQQDAILSKFTSNKQIQLQAALESCKGDEILCYTAAVKFSDAQIQTVSNRLGELYQKDNALGKLVTAHLLPSGCYSFYAGMGDKQMLIKAWEQDVRAINYAIEVYAEGRPPNSPKIDSISFDIKNKRYPEFVMINAKLSFEETKKNSLFYSPALVFALHSLELNGRNQAGDFEPMAKTVNKTALDYAKTVKWQQYKYTLILVPGEGPEEKDVALSAGGMLRCRLAALQYQEGVAPFIMVSGGNVHPYKTKYNEAEEMKKFLMETLHIPEKAILMEPHARHTTTNMRNCARLIFRYGFPMDKPCLTATVPYQSFYVTGDMGKRSIQELGYVPYQNGKRLSNTEAEFYPLSVSLQIDFDEPMDP